MSYEEAFQLVQLQLIDFFRFISHYLLF